MKGVKVFGTILFHVHTKFVTLPFHFISSHTVNRGGYTTFIFEQMVGLAYPILIANIVVQPTKLLSHLSDRQLVLQPLLIPFLLAVKLHFHL